MTSAADFIWQNREADPHKIALSSPPNQTSPPAYLAAQVAGLQKIRHKIPTWYRPGIHCPPLLSLEQSSSEATARFKASLFAGEKMADLTGGFGVDAFFMSENFQNAVYLEQNEALVGLVQQNFRLLGRENLRFEVGEAEMFLKNTRETFDLLFLDPARRDERKGKVFQLADCSPDLLTLKTLLLERAPKVLVKTAPLLDLHLATKQLGNVTQIWVVESEGECREVLYLLENRQIPFEKIPVHAVVLGKTVAPQVFQFTFGEEQSAENQYVAPLTFLYEPFPAILKAGAFRSFAQRNGLGKLHVHTHIYTSADFQAGLPARVFQLQAVCKFDKKEIARHLPNGKANVSVRNFPENTNTVRQRLGLQDGGEHYLFAVTDWQGRKMVLICTKVAV